MSLRMSAILIIRASIALAMVLAIAVSKTPEPRGSIEQNEEDEQDEEDDGIEPIRPQIHRRNREPSPEPRRRFSAGAPSDEFLIRALERATARNGIEHPRSVGALVLDPIAVEYAPLSF